MVGNRQSAEELVGNFDETITIDGVLNSGAIFELMFGQSTDTETTGDYTHTIIDADGTETVPKTAASFSLTENYSGASDVQFTHTGCKLNTIDVDIEQGVSMKFSSEVIATEYSIDATVGTETNVTTTPLSGFNATLSTGTAGAEASVGQTKTVSISINQNIDPTDVKVIGSRLNDCLVEKNLEVTMEFTKVFANTTEAERFLGGTSPSSGQPTETSVIVDVNNGVALGSGKVGLLFEAVGQYDSVARAVSQDGVVEETFSFRARELKKIEFVDQTASYF